MSVQLNGSMSEPGAQYAWTTNCLNGQVVPPNGMNPVLNFDAFDANRNSTTCEVQLTVTKDGRQTQCGSAVLVTQCQFDCKGDLNGNATVDRCGVCGGDGSTCPPIFTTQNIVGIQAGIDLNAIKEKQILTSLLKTYGKVSRNSRAYKKDAKKYRARIDANNQQTWTMVNTAFEANIIVAASGGVQCQTVSFASPLSFLQSKRAESLKTGNELVKKIKRLTRDKKIVKSITASVKRLKDVVTQNTRLIAALPASKQVCS